MGKKKKVKEELDKEKDKEKEKEKDIEPEKVICDDEKVEEREKNKDFMKSVMDIREKINHYLYEKYLPPLEDSRQCSLEFMRLFR